jgi:transketolase
MYQERQVNRTTGNLVRALERKALFIRRQTLRMCVSAGNGHIAPSLSCVEILAALYYGAILRYDPHRPRWGGRDRFILSKGQAAAALYAILADRGFFPASELMNFTKNGSRLGSHVESNVPGVEALTGSLGHGLPIAAGIALAGILDKKKYVCFALLGDGECHEGSVWEAAMFAGQRKLHNLIAIVDNNGLSATDHLKNYLDVAPLKQKWASFGWDVEVVNGHSISELLAVLRTIRSRSSSKPLAIIALTTKGKGISFMENEPIWHYRVPVGKELQIAKRELGLNARRER